MIPLFKVFMPESVMEPLRTILLSGYIGQGEQVDAFERELCSHLRVDHVLTVNSCTSAIHLALRLSGVGPGDEVISTPMTCTATNEPILERGAKIVWADIDPNTGNIDVADVSRKISRKTKAIVCVHWAGYPCDLDELKALGRTHGIKIIEDAAHALGATYKGKMIGAHSDFVCFSFQAIKHMTTVDGGLLVCREDELHKKGKLLRWYGLNREAEENDYRCKQDIVEHGYKFHMNDVSAVIGIEQMKFVSENLKIHQENGRYYDQALKGLKNIELLDYRPDRLSAYWLYTLKVPALDRFMEHMKRAGIAVSQVHARNDKHTMMKKFRTSLPGTDKFTKAQISIPVGWWVTAKDREYIAKTVAAFS